MQKLLTALPLALLLAFPAQGWAQDAPTVTLKQEVPKVGTKWTSKDELKMSLDIDVSMNGKKIQAMNNKSHEKKEWTIEVLAVSKTRVTKVKVSFKDVVATEKGPEGAKEEKAPFANKTYVVDKSGEKASVKDAAGKDVAAELTAAIMEELEDVFKEDRGNVKKLFPARALKLGETIKVKPEVAKEVFGDEDMKEAKLTLTLKETRVVDGVLCAVFSMNMKAGSGPKEVPQMGMEVKGELILEVATSWPRSMSMSGPMTMSGTEKQPDGSVIGFKGGGKISGTKSSVYSKK